ncbi:hypothetical protein IAT38_007908 [Cryptococcus sp. DSM 104549]
MLPRLPRMLLSRRALPLTTHHPLSLSPLLRHASSRSPPSRSRAPLSRSRTPPPVLSGDFRKHSGDRVVYTDKHRRQQTPSRFGLSVSKGKPVRRPPPPPVTPPGLLPRNPARDKTELSDGMKRVGFKHKHLSELRLEDTRLGEVWKNRDRFPEGMLRPPNKDGSDRPLLRRKGERYINPKSLPAIWNEPLDANQYEDTDKQILVKPEPMFKPELVKGFKEVNSAHRFYQFDRPASLGYDLKFEDPGTPPSKARADLKLDPDTADARFPVPAVARPEDARPSTFGSFGLDLGLVTTLREMFKSGKTSPIQTLSFRHFAPGPQKKETVKAEGEKDGADSGETKAGAEVVGETKDVAEDAVEEAVDVTDETGPKVEETKVAVGAETEAKEAEAETKETEAETKEAEAEETETVPIRGLKPLAPGERRKWTDTERVVLAGETGSGKTLAYLVPLFHHLKATDYGREEAPTNSYRSERSLSPRAIVLSPTHELTRQTTQFAKLLGHRTKLRVVGMSNTESGGVGDKRGVADILLGTVGSMRRMLKIPSPNRVDDRKSEDDRTSEDETTSDTPPMVNVDKLEWIVIDEADVLLGEAFGQETLSILNTLPPCNVILCTATIPSSLVNLLNEHPFFASAPRPLPPTTNIHRVSALPRPPPVYIQGEPGTDPIPIVPPTPFLYRPSLFSAKPPITYLLSPRLHKLPTSLRTTFIRNASSSHQHGDIAHQIRITFAEEARMAKERAKAEGRKLRPGEDEESKIVVFCNTPAMAQRVTDMLRMKKLDAMSWSGSALERQRGGNDMLEEFLQTPALYARDLEMAEKALKVKLDEEEKGVKAPEVVPELKGKKAKKASRQELAPYGASASLAKSLLPDNFIKPPKRGFRFGGRVLVTTSILSRGLDFHPSVSSVFLLQPPRDVLDFVHRAGRAGRAGRPGRVVVFGLQKEPWKGMNKRNRTWGMEGQWGKAPSDRPDEVKAVIGDWTTQTSVPEGHVRRRRL